MRRPRNTDPHPLLQQAIRIVGNQIALAAACGSTQQQISRMLNRRIPITAEVAQRIHAVTDGAVPKWALRPDLWDDPTRFVQQTRVQRRVKSEHEQAHG